MNKIFNEKTQIKIKNNIEENKNDFNEIIKLIKYLTIFYYKKRYNFIRLYDNLISIIEKYENKNTWFLKIYLNTFFFDKDKLYISQLEFNLNKIYHIVKKYKLSEIIDLFIESNNLILIKRKSFSDWFQNNKNFFFNNLKGINYLKQYIINDINKNLTFELCLTAKDQLIFIISNYEKVYLKIAILFYS